MANFINISSAPDVLFQIEIKIYEDIAHSLEILSTKKSKNNGY